MPTGLAAAPGDSGALNLTWTAPSGTVTGYDVHYTSALVGTVANDAAVQTGGSPSAADGWVAHSRSSTDTTLSDRITGLTNNTAYRVRVRAKNANGDGAWAHARGTPVVPTMGFYFSHSETINEHGARATETVIVRLSAALSVATMVSIAIDTTRPASGRAVETDDFTLSTKTLSFPAGTTEQRFTVQGVADETTEGAEEFWLTLEAPNAAPYRVGTLSSADLYNEVEVLILDTSLTPGLNFNRGATDSVREGDAIDVIVFLGTVAPMGGTTVTLSLGNAGTATETSDFTLSSKSLTIDEGERSATVKLTAVDDATDDDGETIVLNAASTNPSYTAAQTVTIIDNDPALRMGAPAGLAAAGGPGTLTVTWDAPPSAQTTAYPDYSAVLAWKTKASGPSGRLLGRRFLSTAQRDARRVTLTGLAAEAWEVSLWFVYLAKGDPVAVADAFPLTFTTARVTAEGTPGLSPPSPPRNFRAIPGDNKITLLWDAPASWGSGTPVGYNIQYHCSGCNPGPWADVGIEDTSSTSRVMTRTLVQNMFDLIVNGRASRFRIRAEALKPGAAPDTTEVRDFLSSGFSAEVSATPMAGLADGPTSIALSVNDADKRVDEDAGALTVTAALNAPVTAATDVTLGIGSASTATEGAANDFTLSPKTVTVAAGSTSGTATLTVRDDTDVETDEVVVIKAASGDLAGATLNVTIVDNDETIGAPTALTATPGDGELTLTWTAPSSGTVTGYDVAYKQQSAADQAATGDGTDPSTGWVAVDRGTEASPPSASQTVSSLTNSTAYDVRVRTKASGGNSLWITASGTPSALTALAAPANFALTAGDGEIAASWDAVTGADHYFLWYGIAGSGSTEKVELGEVTAHTVSGLVNGSEYSMTVQARDSTGTHGASAQAAWRQATPEAADSTDAGLLSVTAESAESAVCAAGADARG